MPFHVNTYVDDIKTFVEDFEPPEDQECLGVERCRKLAKTAYAVHDIKKDFGRVDEFYSNGYQK